MELKTFKDERLITGSGLDLYPNMSKKAKKELDKFMGKIVRALMSGVTVDLSSFLQKR